MNAPVKTLTPNQRERRNRILLATRTLVAEHGYEGMIMRDVAEHARVSPTTLYNLYNTKDELLLEALKDRVSQSWMEAIERVPELGLDRLKRQIELSVTQTREESEFARAITQALYRANAGDALLEMLIRDNAKAVAACLEAMRERGAFDVTADVSRIARRFVSYFWSQYFLWAVDLLDLDELHDGLAEGGMAILEPYLNHGAS